MPPPEQKRTEKTPLSFSAPLSSGKVRSYTTLQIMFMLRLERLLRLKRQQELVSTREEWVLKALDRVIYSTLCDCIDQGVGDEARWILKDKPSVS